MVKKITEKEFNEVMSSKLAVVDFSATWCGPCKMLAPVYHEVADEMADKAGFYNVDIDESAALAEQFHIQMVPTLLVLKDGEKVDMQVGFQPKESIVEMIKKHLV